MTECNEHHMAILCQKMDRIAEQLTGIRFELMQMRNDGVVVKR